MQIVGGRAVMADEAYLRDCIILPDKYRVAGFPPIMPNFSGTVSEGQIVGLVAYIKSLTNGDRGQDGASPMTDAALPFMPPLRSGRESYLEDGHTFASWLSDDGS